jgi:DNA-binding NarL/FixJ family response regulator/signal transduction histidine kinase
VDHGEPAAQAAGHEILTRRSGRSLLGPYQPLRASKEAVVVGPEPMSPLPLADPESPWATALAVTAVAEDLAGEFSLRPLLERILLRSTQLLGCDAGSICSVDEAAGTYRKEADIGIHCRSGQVFPLTEGMTGAVVARRRAVWFERYDDVHGGHVSAEDRADLRGVIGVPLEWTGSIIGVCVVFSRDPDRQFGPADADLLHLFAKHAAVALTNARLHEEAEERARAQATAAERGRLLREVYDTVNRGFAEVLGQLDVVGQSLTTDGNGDGRYVVAEPAVRAAREAARDALVETRRAIVGLLDAPPDGRTLRDTLQDEVAWAARTGRLDARLVVAGPETELEPALTHEIMRIAQEALTNIVQHADAGTVRLGVAFEAHGVSLLVQDDGRGFDPQALADDEGFGLRRMVDRARAVGGHVELDSLPGWGTSLRVRFPTARPGGSPRRPALRVMVVDAAPVVRAGVARLLSRASPSIEVVGEAADAREAASLQDAVEADVVVTGLRPTAAGEADGIVLTRLMVEKGRAAVVCLAEPGDDDLVMAALRAGAQGCLDRQVSGPALAQAVVAAGRGQAVLSAPALQGLHRGLRADEALTGPTAREREVRALIEQGLQDKQIAVQLAISVKTVEKHVGSLLRKTGAHNRTELVALSRRSR